MNFDLLKKEIFLVSKLVIKSKSVIHDVIKSEAVVMNLETGLYFTFNAPATLIWLQIKDSVCSETEIYDYAGAQNLHFIKFILNEGLIVRESILNSPIKSLLKLDPIEELAQWYTFSDMKDLLLLDPVHDIALGDHGWPEFKND